VDVFCTGERPDILGVNISGDSTALFRLVSLVDSSIASRQEGQQFAARGHHYLQDPGEPLLELSAYT
jgi:hypothetical protein